MAVKQGKCWRRNCVGNGWRINNVKALLKMAVVKGKCRKRNNVGNNDGKAVLEIGNFGSEKVLEKVLGIRKFEGKGKC